MITRFGDVIILKKAQWCSDLELDEALNKQKKEIAEIAEIYNTYERLQN